MTASRHPKLSRTLRVIAGTCAVFWLVGPLLCAAERISVCLGHEPGCAGHATPAHHPDIEPAREHEQSHGVAQAHQHNGGEPRHEHNSDGKHGCDERFCCSTMQALLPTAKAIVIANSISHRMFAICHLNTASGHTLAASDCEPFCQLKPREWGFTPIVCLGPAHRPVGPPYPEAG